MNRYYGDGLNKLEPKDVEALGCPEFSSQSAGDCERMHGDLIRLEGLSADERQRAIDALTGRMLGLGAA